MPRYTPGVAGHFHENSFWFWDTNFVTLQYYPRGLQAGRFQNIVVWTLLKSEAWRAR